MRSFEIIWAVLLKDLRVEWRSRETLATTSVFGVLVVFLFNFPLEPGREENLRLLPILLWVTFAFVGILAFNRSFATERENNCLEGLILAPVDPGLIYAGKMLANLLFLGVAEAVVVFAAALWYNFSFVPSMKAFVAIVFLGTLGYTAVGTIFGAVAANTKMREVMLPVLQFPVAFPILLAAIEATSGALRGSPVAEFSHGIQMLLGIAVVYFVASYLLFEYVIGE